MIALIAAAVLATGLVEEALDSLSWEPDCATVVEAALSASGPPPDHVASTTRIRLAALLPKLRVTVEKSLEHDQSLDEYSDGEIRFAIDTDDDLEIRGYVQWDLSNLIHAPAESSAAGRRLDDARWRLDLSSDVVEAYHERRRLQVLLILGWLEPPDAVMAALRIVELTALLDAFTGGWFSAELEKKKNPPA
ncbi:MAG: hypothetical protein JRG91_10685 [Deltaproteobacteria bacterium]|nr:hypothetical protein [Deltaproteobacteria bacterium]